MTDTINLDNITIVLHHPRFAENIGSTARCMRNMGITRLHVVSKEEIDINRALVLSTHVAADIVHTMQRFNDLKSAVAHSGYVVGTTARLGKSRQVLKTPVTLARALVPISRENNISIVFGPEDRGLTNDELRNCHDLVNIRTAEFSSINLAQAVMIVCYELFNASVSSGNTFQPRLALRPELDAMYEQLKNILVRISFIQPDHPEYWMDRFRRFFSRLPLRAAEVSIIRGICRQIDWYARKCYEDGKNGREPDFEKKINSAEHDTGQTRKTG
jgi:tRNA/rRNA methyltransferase